MTDANRWVVIPAAGKGRRMGSELPKQYLPLCNRMVIEHTLERLLLHPGIDGVYLALDPRDPHWETTEYAGHPDIVRVSGGDERAHSVLNALEALQQRADPGDWVLVHDAARPCVRRSDIDLLISEAGKHPVGGVLGVALHDTLKRTDESNHIEATVDRRGLWRAFTPQMFRLGELFEALSQALAAGVVVTDEASAIEWAGLRPRMVPGHADNIKITQAEDLELASFFLQRQLEN